MKPKPPRSALPLPRYTIRKPLRSGEWGYFFQVPYWARKKGCPVESEPLEMDYEAAVLRAETVLLPAFDSWRSCGDDAKPGVGICPARSTGSSMNFARRGRIRPRNACVR